MIHPFRRTGITAYITAQHSISHYTAYHSTAEHSTAQRGTLHDTALVQPYIFGDSARDLDTAPAQLVV